ncbi:MAG: hypothetical protein SNH35_03580 [Rikenellaceae bacterium]
MSKTEFGRRIGVSSAFITSMRQSLQPDKIQSIATEFEGLNITWLLTGEGSMLKKTDEPTKIMNHATPPTDVVMSREVFAQISKLTDTILSQQQLIAAQQQTIDKLLCQISQNDIKL